MDAKESRESTTQAKDRSFNQKLEEDRGEGFEAQQHSLDIEAIAGPMLIEAKRAILHASHDGEIFATVQYTVPDVKGEKPTENELAEQTSFYEAVSLVYLLLESDGYILSFSSINLNAFTNKYWYRAQYKLDISWSENPNPAREPLMKRFAQSILKRYE